MQGRANTKIDPGGMFALLSVASYHHGTAHVTLDLPARNGNIAVLLGYGRHVWRRCRCHLRHRDAQVAQATAGEVAKELDGVFIRVQDLAQHPEQLFQVRVSPRQLANELPDAWHVDHTGGAIDACKASACIPQLYDPVVDAAGRMRIADGAEELPACTRGHMQMLNITMACSVQIQKCASVWFTKTHSTYTDGA